MIKLLLVVLAIAVIARLVSAALVRGRKSHLFPYELKKAIFSPAERSFLGVLDQAAAPDYRVFGKVRIADVVEVGKVANKSLRTSAFNKISSKHFDYVVCRADDMRPVCAVELDDKSHAAPSRQKRDSFVESVCTASGLPLLRVPAKHAYTVSDLRTALLERIAPTATGQPDTAVDRPTQGPAAAKDLGEAPRCPKCSSGMQLRKVTSGAKAGTAFWGCDDFPTCRGCILT